MEEGRGRRRSLRRNPFYSDQTEHDQIGQTSTNRQAALFPDSQSRPIPTHQILRSPHSLPWPSALRIPVSTRPPSPLLPSPTLPARPPQPAIHPIRRPPPQGSSLERRPGSDGSRKNFPFQKYIRSCVQFISLRSYLRQRSTAYMHTYCMRATVSPPLLAIAHSALRTACAVNLAQHIPM